MGHTEQYFVHQTFRMFASWGPAFGGFPVAAFCMPASRAMNTVAVMMQNYI